MEEENVKTEEIKLTPYVTPLGAWAMALGTSIGWGSVFVTSNTYLLEAGPIGTAAGLIIGALVMIIMSKSYHYMMNCFPDCGGVYTYTKETFGYDQGFVAAWFLALTYFAMFWANVTALPLFSRYFFGNLFKFGYLYTLFGAYDVYLGEVLLSMAAIILFTFICARSNKVSINILIGTVVFLTAGIIVCTFIGLTGMNTFHRSLSPGFIPESSEIRQIVRIAAISPWAFIGFENISHATEEFTFKRSRVFRILTIAVISSTVLYILITLLSVSAYPSENATWLDYIRVHGSLDGLRGLPAFYAANYYMGNRGVIIMMIVLLCLIISSLIGNTLALSRLLYALAKDSILPEQLSVLNSRGIPSNAIKLMACISLVIPLLGRTAIGWIVDVTTIGATIVYAFVSASAYKLASLRDDRPEKAFGMAGTVIMIGFAMMLLLPALFGTGDLASETYFLFTIWAILGFIFFRTILKRDKSRRFGRTVVVWVALLGMIMFTTLVWMGEASLSDTDRSISNIRHNYMQRIVEDERTIESFKDPSATREELNDRVNEDTVDVAYEDEELQEEIAQMRRDSTKRVLTVFALFMLAVGILLNNYSVVIRRADENEYELGIERQKAHIDSLTGVKNKRTYDDFEKSINQHIADGVCDDFSIVICDINGLKHVNDNYGHKAGDDLIRSASQMICSIFKHSPVFRIGGDEFVVILTGRDRVERGTLMHEINRRSEENIKEGRVVVAAGMSDYIPNYDESVKPVFDRADLMMYERKEELKEKGAESR